MARYINTGEIGIGKCNPDVFKDKEYARGWNDAVELIEKTPTADVVEVVHGEWIEEWDSEHFVSSCVCSACRRGTCRDSLMKWIKSAYCPNCGAKMDGKKVE